jgi:hypothetical protein
MQIIGDNSIFIENSLHAIEEHLIVGGHPGVNVVVFFFSGISVRRLLPRSRFRPRLSRHFALIYAMGYTLNSDHDAFADLDGWNRD